MEKTPTPTDFPLRPIDAGETLVQVFRSAAALSADGSEHEVTPRPPRETRSRSSIPPLQRKLYEAEGKPVRLGCYDVLRCVGTGGMGIVYEAINVEHGHRVALKTLRWMTAAGLCRFKNEFRSLRGVAHPNLVGLYELGVEDDEWFFTMELVEGQSFIDHVLRDGERGRGGWEYLGETIDEGLPRSGEPRSAEPRSRDSGPLSFRRGVFHEGRLRAALRQLAAAVAALHDMGKLHRDLNPGNVLVTRDGRVVVLDFGLISDRVRRPGASYDGASGTPAYMSPEQAAGKPATPASDWYGFGVMLFEALTGQLPFSGNTLRLLSNKRLHDAPRPSSIVTGLPADLENLCAGLLQRVPEDRPDAEVVLRVLGATPARARPPEPIGDELFVGRIAELAALDDARKAATPGFPVAVVVHGPTGIGKTSLVARFLHEAATRDGALVLRGACHERESIPHRALDAIIDALASYLGALTPDEARSIVPAGGRELARVFPVLEGLEAMADHGARSYAPGSIEAADAAFACLRELLARIAAERPLIVCLDDAQLGDREGAKRLADLVSARGPTPAPGLLLIVVHSGEDLFASPVLPEIVRGAATLRYVAIGPLDEREARAVALHALPDEMAEREEAAASIAAASGGSPLAALELALRVEEAGDGAHVVSLDDVIASRLARLPEHARRLVEIVAAAGKPIERSLLFAVSSTARSADAALAALAAARLLRVAGVRGADHVRIHDERVRDVVAAHTPPAVTRQIHLRLGRALAARGDDPAEIADHFRRAGAVELAGKHAAEAAERAAAVRDFERAAALFAQALACRPPGTPAARALAVRRAEALAGAGRSAEAARAYLDAANGAPWDEAIDRKRCAAEHLLVAGHVDEGLLTLRPVLDAHGVGWPASQRRAMWALAKRVLELRVRGARLPIDARPPTPAARARVEALWTAAKALSGIDPVRSGVFTIETLLSAIAEGDIDHAVRALAFVGSMLVYEGSASEEERGLALIEEASRYARRSGDPYQLGFSWFCSGLARMCAGRFREALARVDEALGFLEPSSAALAWERNAHRTVSIQVLFELGALRERARRADAWLREAREKGDRAGEVLAALASSFTILASGDAIRARAAVHEAIALSWRGGFGVPHQIALWIEVSTLLYEGAASTARDRLLSSWPALDASKLLHIQLVRIEAILLRGLTAIAVARESGSEPLCKLAEADAVRLTRERKPHAIAAAALLTAGVARARGQIARAIAGLDEAARAYASVEMIVHAAAARRTRGTLLGGTEGLALIADADAVLAEQGVRDPARWSAMYTGIAR